MDEGLFFDAVRRDPFKGRLNPSQVKGMQGILEAFRTHGDGREKTLAYALATTFHETGRRMVPVREGFASSDAAARRAVNNLARKRGAKSAVAKYSKPAGPYGHVYYGRGRVQETWLENYKRSGDDIGIDLVKDPDLHLDPVIDARILIRGLLDGRWNGKRKGIASYLTDTRDDLKNARRTVNITDKWQLIAGYYKAFLAAIEAAGGVSGRAKPKPPTYSVRDVQRRLLDLGYVQVGAADGIMGDKTKGAILAFRDKNGLPLSDEIDVEFIEALGSPKAKGPDLAPERTQATEKDLRKAGSSIAKNSFAQKAGVVLAGTATVAKGGAEVAEKTGIIQTLTDAGDTVSQVTEAISPFQSLIGTLQEWGLIAVDFLWIPAAGLIGWVGWKAYKISKARLRDHQTGNTSVVGLSQE